MLDGPKYWYNDKRNWEFSLENGRAVQYSTGKLWDQNTAAGLRKDQSKDIFIVKSKRHPRFGALVIGLYIFQ